MKKVLFATTALVATAGIASADITLSGDGRLGLNFTDGEASQEYRMRLSVTGSAEADNGLSVSLFTRLAIDEAFTTTGVTQDTGANSGTAFTDDNGFNGARITLSYGAVSVSAGNTDGAVANIVNLYPAVVGTDGFADYRVPAFNAAGGNTEFTSNGNGAAQTRIGYAAGGVAVAVSGTVDDGMTELAASYTMGDATVAVGMVNTDTVESTFASVTVSAGALSGGLSYVNSDAGDAPGYALGVAYKVDDALTIDALYADSGDGVFMDDDVYAVGFDYALGGGITATGSVGQNHSGDTHHTLGLTFRF